MTKAFHGINDLLDQWAKGEMPPKRSDFRGGPEDALRVIKAKMGEAIATLAADPEARELRIDQLLDDDSFPVNRTDDDEEDSFVAEAMLDMLPFLIEHPGDQTASQAAIVRIVARLIEDVDGASLKRDAGLREYIETRMIRGEGSLPYVSNRISSLSERIASLERLVEQRVGTHTKRDSDLDDLDAKVGTPSTEALKHVSAFSRIEDLSDVLAGWTVEFDRRLTDVFDGRRITTRAVERIEALEGQTNAWQLLFDSRQRQIDDLERRLDAERERYESRLTDVGRQLEGVQSKLVALHPDRRETLHQEHTVEVTTMTETEGPKRGQDPEVVDSLGDPPISTHESDTH